MAKQLLAQGQKVDFLAIIYTYLKGSIRLPGLRKRIELHIESFRESSLTEKITYLPKRIVKIKNLAIQKLFPGKTRHAEGAAPKAPFMPTYYSGKITLFQPTGGMGNMVYDPMMGWNGLAADIEKFDVPGAKLSIFKDPHVQTLADFFRQCLNKSTSEGQ